MMHIHRRILCLSVLLSTICLSSAADDSILVRNCRPQLQQRVLPASHRALRQGGEETNKMIGERRQLVVLVSFSDQSFTDADPLTLWGRIFNEHDFSESPFVGSVHDYFYEQSYGKFDLTFDMQLVELPESRVKYRSTQADDENSQYLVYDIVDELSTRDIDWSQYDWDNDGYIDQLLIVYAGKGMNAGGGSNTIWPHQWWLSLHTGGHVCTVTSGEKDYTVDCYCCVQELYINNDYGSFGTICHEYSHCFGLPDFYNGSTSYVKSWDLMDSGNNNGEGFCPCNYSAHERMLMGWLTPTELTTDISIDGMPQLDEQPVAYLIRNDGHADEYYVVENRQQTGWDQTLTGSGLVVFHVDYDAKVWANEMPNSSKRKRYTIIPANNRTSVYQSSGWPYPYVENNLLTNDSAPAATLLNANTDGSMLMNKSLTNISVTSGLASFNFSATGTGIAQHVAADSQRPTVLYRFGSINIIRNAQGEIRKVIRK